MARCHAGFLKALSLNPTYFDIRTKFAQALREAGRNKDAITELKSVLSHRANYCPALVQLGVTLYMMEKIPEAKKAWKSALEKESENPYARMYLRLCDATEKAYAGKKQSRKAKIKPRKR